MTLLDEFRAATRGNWTTSGLGVQWRFDVYGSDAALTFMYTNDGHDGAHDWLHNFMFLPRYTRFGFAHYGISRMFESAISDLCAAMDAWADVGIPRTLRIRGFSQGGALALAAHDFFTRRYYANVDVSTVVFAPPPYWHRFALFDEVLERAKSVQTIYVRGDIVALSTLLFGFRHVGRVVRLGRVSLPRFSKHNFAVYEAELAKENT